MKKLIFVISAIISSTSSFADEVKKENTQYSTYEVVNESFIGSLQDSLEVDSLLEFRIDHIVYSDLSDIDMNSILEEIGNKRYPSLNKAESTFGVAHYAYDEENRKLYSGKTFVAIIQSSLAGFGETTEVIIFWAKPSPRKR